MKKRLLLAALSVLAATTLSHAQFSMDLDVIGRFDVRPGVTYGGEGFCDFGNSSLNVKAEASLGEHVSFLWVGHLLDTFTAKIPFGGTADCYCIDGTPTFLRNDVSNWTQFMLVSLNFGGWTFNLGKDACTLGGFEFDSWDWENHIALTSLHWQSACCYQWGGSVVYSTPSEQSEFTLQAVSNDCNGMIWDQGLGTYSFKYYGSYGPIELSHSIGFSQTSHSSSPEGMGGIGIIGLGVRGNISDNLSVSLEWMNRRDVSCGGFSFTDGLGNSSKTILAASYAPSDKWDFGIKAGYEHIGLDSEIGIAEMDDQFNCFWGGAYVNFAPLKSTKDFKITGSIATSTYDEAVTFSVGVLYDLKIKI